MRHTMGRSVSARTSKTICAAEALKVKQPAASTATVHLARDGDATVFHIHGGGLVTSRMVNEFGIAKKAAEAITEAFGGRS